MCTYKYIYAHVHYLYEYCKNTHIYVCIHTHTLCTHIVYISMHKFVWTPIPTCRYSLSL